MSRKQKQRREHSRREKQLAAESRSVKKVVLQTEAKRRENGLSTNRTGSSTPGGAEMQVTRKKLIKVLGWLGTAEFLIGLVSYSLPPSIQTPVPLLDNEPLSAPIELTNENPLPLLSLESQCSFDVRGPRVILNDVGYVPFASKRWIIWPKGKMTVRCDEAFNLGHMTLSAARMSVYTKYRPLLFPYQFERQTKFKAVIRDKAVRWIAD